MPFSFLKKRICCPNCMYEGPVQIVGAKPHFRKWWVLVLIAFVIHPLVGTLSTIAIWIALKPAQYICPECGCEIPLFLRNRFFPN